MNQPKHFVEKKVANVQHVFKKKKKKREKKRKEKKGSKYIGLTKYIYEIRSLGGGSTCNLHTGWVLSTG